MSLILKLEYNNIISVLNANSFKKAFTISSDGLSQLLKNF